MGRRRHRQPDVSLIFGLNYPKGESARLKVILALVGAIAIITGALITSGILPDWVGNAWHRIVGDGPPPNGKSGNKSEATGPEAQAPIAVGHRGTLSSNSSAAGQGGQELLDVAAGGGRFVAVGWTGTTSASDGAVWISENGRDWAPATDPTDAFRHRPGIQKLYGVVASANELVAVGSDGEAAAIWISENGQEWAAMPSEAGALSEGGTQSMRSVIRHGPILVAVGARGPDGGREAAGWYWSTKGMWRRATVRSGAAKPSTDAVMRDVAWVGDKLVAIGSTRIGRRAGYDAAVWTSADGRTWTQLAPADVDERCASGCSGDQAMYSVAADEGSAVAVGLAGAPNCGWHAAVWRSVDGSTWQRMLEAKALNGKGKRMNAVAPTGDGGFIAVGSQGCRGQQRAAVWLSPDGVDWQPLEVESTPGFERMAGTALSPQRGIIGGSRGDKLTASRGLTWRVTFG